MLGNDLQIADLSFGWIPIDVDLISLNLPEAYTNYFLHGDTAWPYHFGQMLGHVLETVIAPDQSPTDINVSFRPLFSHSLTVYMRLRKY